MGPASVDAAQVRTLLLEAVVTSLSDCPVAPQYRTTVQTLTLHKACDLLGGLSKLANYLHVSPISLTRWLDGQEKPPTRVFLDCVDIILFHERHLPGPRAS
jgi:hypothetical protein